MADVHLTVKPYGVSVTRLPHPDDGVTQLKWRTAFYFVPQSSLFLSIKGGAVQKTPPHTLIRRAVSHNLHGAK